MFFIHEQSECRTSHVFLCIDQSSCYTASAKPPEALQGAPGVCVYVRRGQGRVMRAMESEVGVSVEPGQCVEVWPRGWGEWRDEGVE